MRPLILALLLPFPAQAACTGTTLLSCTVKADLLEVCLNGDSLTYAFGPKGAPDIRLSEPLDAGTYTPWPGIGGSIWESIAFRNGATTHTVFMNFDRMTEGALPEWGVSVKKSGNLVKTMVCDTTGTATPFDGLFAEMETRGFCWNRALDQWQTGGCP